MMAKEWAAHRNSKVLVPRMASGITRKDASVSDVDATRVNVECTEDWPGESETGKVPEDTGEDCVSCPVWEIEMCIRE